MNGNQQRPISERLPLIYSKLPKTVVTIRHYYFRRHNEAACRTERWLPYRSSHLTTAGEKMAALPKNVGWVGLGIMGLPMAINLHRKMEKDTQFYVYDVVQANIDKLVDQGEGRVHACSSSKEVADKSVCHASLQLHGISTRSMH